VHARHLALKGLNSNTLLELLEG